MKNRLIWKFIFLLSLLLTLNTLNQNLKMPNEVLVNHPDFLAYGLLFFDFFVILGSFGYAFKIKILYASIWKLTAIIYPVFLIIEAALDFIAGGYTIYEMFTHSLLMCLLTGLFIAPIIMYLDDFKTSPTKI